MAPPKREPPLGARHGRVVQLVVARCGRKGRGEERQGSLRRKRSEAGALRRRRCVWLEDGGSAVGGRPAEVRLGSWRRGCNRGSARPRSESAETRRPQLVAGRRLEARRLEAGHGKGGDEVGRLEAARWQRRVEAGGSRERQARGPTRRGGDAASAEACQAGHDGVSHGGAGCCSQQGQGGGDLKPRREPPWRGEVEVVAGGSRQGRFGTRGGLEAPRR